eukprot:CAMPEP_0113644124 /NCGR_PEP_ID=MMETSP0017_2-20120614/23215_1 /TAXON_ID=2856 /ORGANISM="Cylindrotheca closterium" /LENGTH=54 /DNA_ID=CAMNT_0000555703 /DNA_START=1 /DNA_END=162 /DNA_ORIENTATION=- /assembly_acc=CAM_ASM_000147
MKVTVTAGVSLMMNLKHVIMTRRPVLLLSVGKGGPEQQVNHELLLLYCERQNEI